MTRARFVSTSIALLPIAAVLAACATTGSPATGAAQTMAIDPRYEAVHNALAGAGMSEVGALIHGTLAKGAEVRVPVELRPPCSTLVVLGSAGMGDIDATLSDAAGRILSRDTTTDAEPVVKACVAERGPYILTLKANAGSGDYLLSEYTGEGVAPGALAKKDDGSCEAPFNLAVGRTSGSSAHTGSSLEGTCGNTTGHEVIYRLELRERRHVVIDVDPKFDAVLYIRKDSCSDDSTEVDCNDDSGEGRHSKLDETLDAGVYFVVVDSGNEGGQFSITVESKPADPLSRACKHAPPLEFGSPVRDVWEGATNLLSGDCAGDEHGPDRLYKLTVPPPTAQRVRLTQENNVGMPVLYVRPSCDENAGVVSCANASDGTAASLASVLEPGDYVVVADNARAQAMGGYTLTAERTSVEGGGVEGDSCGSAIPIRESREIEGDTFDARDDVTSKCGLAGAPDVVYRIEASHRTRLTATLAKHDANQVLSLSRGCGRADMQKAVACGDTIATTITPGSWFLTVDGATKDQFGRYVMNVEMHDARPQERACKSAPMIALESTIQGDTKGGVDAFTSSCGTTPPVGRLTFGGGPSAAGPGAGSSGNGNADRVFRFQVQKRAQVTAELTTSGWPGIVTIRKSCEDGGSDVELACNAGAADTSAQVETVAEKGTYFVIVDGDGFAAGGTFKLHLSTIAVEDGPDE